HKGRRYCFVAAILDSPTLESKVMAIDIFTGGKSTAKQPKDYHGMFDTEYYVAWFGRLLDEMDEGGITNALIVLDNAKYHKSLPKTTPTSGRRKGVSWSTRVERTASQRAGMSTRVSSGDCWRRTSEPT
ncbi:hypothetical protein DYB28_006858, partial [Aphanomyces astaci]